MSKKLWCRKCQEFEMHDSRSQTEIEKLRLQRGELADRIEELEAENERLESALRRICSPEKRFTNHGYYIAREALEDGDEIENV